MKASPWLILGACLLTAGCSSVRANAVHTGGERLPARTGPVALYALDAPAGAKELGYVEVSAVGEEGNVETLLPAFVEKVAKLGGNAAHIEGTQARFELVPRSNYDTMWYPCGFRMCAGTRMWTTMDEAMVVRMYGRALFVEGLGTKVPLGKPISMAPVAGGSAR